MIADTYLGRWELIPELCIYEQGAAPKSGLYSLVEEPDGAVSISISWIDRNDEKHSVEFGGVPDGSSQPTKAPGLTHMTLIRISDSILDSAAFNGKDQKMYARRIAHNGLLTTVQRITTDDGTFSIFQVYKRASA